MRKWFEICIAVSSLLLVILVAGGILTPVQNSSEVMTLSDTRFPVPVYKTFPQPMNVRYSITSNCTVDTLIKIACFRKACEGTIDNIDTLTLKSSDSCTYTGIIRFTVA